MLYDIYFHNDFDGRASAAVMLAFLRSRGDNIEHFVPVKYGIMPQWLREDFMQKNKLVKGRHNPAIVVDFLYHPGATFWFEHHGTTFKKKSWEKNFKPTKYLRYKPSCQSACRVAYDGLREGFGWKPPAYLKRLIHWLDIIDGANYKSARQTINMREPAIQVNNFIEHYTDDIRRTVHTVKALSEKSVAEFAKELDVKKCFAALRRDTKKAVQFYREHIQLVGNVAVIDLTGFHYGDLAHYGIYYLHPKMLYGIRFHPYPKRPGLFHVNISANPWRRRDNQKDIGALLKKYGGGGHKNVGGIEITGRKKTLTTVAIFTAFLNQE